jgi:hypothetical protein
MRFDDEDRPSAEEPRDWDDVEIDHLTEVGERRSLAVPIWIGLVILGFGLGFYFYFVHREAAPPPGEPTVAEETTTSTPPIPEQETAPGEPTLELPSLDESDPLAGQLVRQLSSHPKLASLLVGKDLIRRFVVVVDNIAEGVSPWKHLEYVRPEGVFRVDQRLGSYYIDPRGYDRYDWYADVFASIDAQGAAKLYRDLKPLIQEAYVEMGYPDRPFDYTFSRAIARLLDTPVVEGNIELYPKAITYEFADPALEKLSPTQKHFLRMGPRNVRKVQAELRRLEEALGFAR